MTDDTPTYGVHSEVGTLRKVLVCAPGLAHERLTPSNCDDLLFDDVMWVQNAQRDHVDFIAEIRERGVEVVELHDLLTETLDIPGANHGCSTARSCPTRWAWASSIRPGRPRRPGHRGPGRFLIGGLATDDLPDELRGG